MQLKKYKPTTPGQRFKSSLDFAEISKTRPEKSLITSLPRKSGRSKGKVTQRGRGGRHKRNMRMVDFKRDKREIEAKVAALEYDPNRTANIALLHYSDGEKRYILAPEGLKVQGTIIAAKEGDWIHLKLPSKEIRKVNKNCYATIGQLGNLSLKSMTLGKAGRSRYFGKKPHVRGVAQDPGSHPHGGGEGKSGTGMNPKTPTGKPVFKKTRNKKKPSSKFILQRRK